MASVYDVCRMPTGAEEGALCGMRETGQVNITMRSEFGLENMPNTASCWGQLCQLGVTSLVLCGCEMSHRSHFLIVSSVISASPGISG